MEADPWVVLKKYRYPLIIIAVGLVVYFNMLFNGFVWDDIGYVVLNPDVHSINIIGLFQQNLFNNAGQYRPLTAVIFSILYSLFNSNAFFYHLLQLVAHILTSLLLFLVLKKMFKSTFALLGSLLFLIHPIQVESVSFIGSIDNPAFMIPGILAFLLSMDKKTAKKRFLLISLLLLGSILIKETGILFIPIILIYRYSSFDKTRFFLSAIYSGIVVAIYFFIRFFIGKTFFNTISYKPIETLNLFQRILNLPAILFYYIRTFAFPYNLAIDQQWVINSMNFQSFYLPLLLDCIFLFFLTFLGAYIYKRNRTLFYSYIFFTLWFVLGFALHSQIFPLDATVADRWFYFPIIGLIGMGLCIVQFFYPKKYLPIFYTVSIIIIILFSVRTIIRNVDWYDELTLYTHDLKIYESSDIENRLGSVYVSLSNYPEALLHYKKSIEISVNESNLSNLAYVYLKLKNYQKAEEYYVKSLEVRKFPEKEHNIVAFSSSTKLVLMYYSLSDYKKARDFALLYLKQQPQNGSLWAALAVTEYNLGDKNQAKEAITKAKTYSNIDIIEVLYEKIFNNLPILINP
jgi:tetratricopeptide (TPR) repeat protein